MRCSAPVFSRRSNLPLVSTRIASHTTLAMTAARNTQYAARSSEQYDSKNALFHFHIIVTSSTSIDEGPGANTPQDLREGGERCTSDHSTYCPRLDYSENVLWPVILSRSSTCMNAFNEHRNSCNAAICILFQLLDNQGSRKNQNKECSNNRRNVHGNLLSGWRRPVIHITFFDPLS